jgi:hypothetical protein
LENHSDTKDIKIIIVSLMVMVVIVLMYLTKPSDQDHANALSKKLSGGYTTLAHVLSPSPVYTDLFVISCTTLAGHVLTIGVFDHVYVHATFRMIQSKVKSNNGQGV